MPDNDRERWRISLQGIVQGVGMRPFVFRLAVESSLVGHVLNDAHGVTILVEGSKQKLSSFFKEVTKGPTGSMVQSSCYEIVANSPDIDFKIASTDLNTSGISSPPADRNTCEGCLKEFHEPTNRRFKFAFINCTECGPRFSIVERMPFDRNSTSMRDFQMCGECENEYHDPNNRRFHAQVMSCPKCGPRLHWHEKTKEDVFGNDATKLARDKLAEGGIIAVKGIGGYQFMCDATNSTAVARLRFSKSRGEKPFALIAPSIELVQKYVFCDEKETAALTAVERPIVILRKLPKSCSAPIAENISPGINTLGFQLPCTPLHQMLMDDKPYLLTSANLSGDPLIIDDCEAFKHLPQICDGILSHNRRITIRCDDSVIQFQQNQPMLTRRSRGFSPGCIELPKTGPTILAIGGDGKSSLALAIGKMAYLNAHVGDIRNWEGLKALEAATEHMLKIFQTVPEAIACDAHPGYLTNQWAKDFARQNGIPCISAYHHHAHAEALRIDSQIGEEPFLAVCLDGTGFGPDETIWGGEFLLATRGILERVASVKCVPLPGGDQAVEHPARMALSHLYAAGVSWKNSFPSVNALSIAERNILRHQLEKEINCRPTSSIGRLFDAVASLIGIRQSVTYEAQAAIELEFIADESSSHAYEWRLIDELPFLIDTAPMFAAIAKDLEMHAAASKIAGRFHATVADIIARICNLIRLRRGVNRIGLTGGVCQNVKLMNLIKGNLKTSKFKVFLHRRVPCNDGGLALGQLMVGRKEFAHQQTH